MSLPQNATKASFPFLLLTIIWNEKRASALKKREKELAIFNHHSTTWSCATITFVWLSRPFALNVDLCIGDCKNEAVLRGRFLFHIQLHTILCFTRQIGLP